jgi:hypothetical protein
MDMTTISLFIVGIIAVFPIAWLLLTLYDLLGRR